MPGHMTGFALSCGRDNDWEGLPGGDEALGLCGAAGLARQQQGAQKGRIHRRLPGPRQSLEGQKDGGTDGQSHPHCLISASLQGVCHIVLRHHLQIACLT